MQTIVKPEYNTEYHIVEFRRPDGQGQLGPSEIIVSTAITVIDAGGNDVTSAMVDTVGPNNSTQVIYRLFGGTAGGRYLMHVRIVTSAHQQLEEQFMLQVI